MREEDLIRFIRGKYEVEDVICYLLLEQRVMDVTFKNVDGMREFTKDYKYAKDIMMVEGLRLTMPRDEFESILLISLVTVLYSNIFFGEMEDAGKK